MTESLPAGFPDLATLERGLQRILANGSSSQARVARRVPNLEGSFPHEVVTCSVGGKELTIFCKYGSTHTVTGYGHRGGVVREVDVYRLVLASSRASSARFIGSWIEPRTGATWLVVEYLENGLRANKAHKRDGMLTAARWIGAFHAEQERLHDRLEGVVPRYDLDYYRGWIERTVSFAERPPAWLVNLTDRAEAVFAPLLDRSLTVVHGEYYPKNILVVGQTAFPVDWESTAVGAGEVDLAMLTENWGPDIVRQCVDEYCSARWASPQPDFERAFLTARLYTQFRWLGDYPKRFTRENKRLEWAHAIAQELELV
jgi:aminoglycoside phosphotransferase (APT) family kinase protein